MEKYFGNAYRGDPGVPHADPERFMNIWIGSATFSALTWFNPYMWQLSNQFNWHDKAMLFEQYHWKKAREKNQPYKFKLFSFSDSGTKCPMKYENRTTSTGLSTSLSVLPAAARALTLWTFPKSRHFKIHIVHPAHSK
ncbi:UNVERIFIED_CONTAM: hypothetical protein Slati_3585800 [Sesamum latifolium]|uniref:Uncharacterized protein n=1 Tax=Sesamum latifolium TaxID=2727402 RepID=A0AAW2U2S5_9LAMI